MVEIRREVDADRAGVRASNERAFGRAAEANLVDMLRAARRVLVSLVAVDGGDIVGHVLFSAVTVADAPSGFRAAGLAPMSVIPERQSLGIGSQLVRAGLRACAREGCEAVVVLGHPTYYERFGFVRASVHALLNEYHADAAFMVLALTEGALARISGLVKYAPEFTESEC